MGLVEPMCDLICSIKSCQDHSAINGEAVTGTSGESWACASVDKLIAGQAVGAMSLALLSKGEKHTAGPSRLCLALMVIVSLTVTTFKLWQFLLFISALALAIWSCSCFHSLTATFHCLDSDGGSQVKFPKVVAVCGWSSWFWSGEGSPGFIEGLLVRRDGYSDEVVGVIIIVHG